jgi:hypothetical protein
VVGAVGSGGLVMRMELGGGDSNEVLGYCVYRRIGTWEDKSKPYNNKGAVWKCRRCGEEVRGYGMTAGVSTCRNSTRLKNLTKELGW